MKRKSKVIGPTIIFIWYFLVFIGIVAFLSFFVKSITIPVWLSLPGTFTLSIYLIFKLLYFIDRIRITKQLRAMPLEELKRETYRFSTSYFSEVMDEASVIRFKELIQEKNLTDLIKEWGSLRRIFDTLHTEKWGHSDPYDGYDLYLRELQKRIKIEELREGNDP